MVRVGNPAGILEKPFKTTSEIQEAASSGSLTKKEKTILILTWFLSAPNFLLRPVWTGVIVHPRLSSLLRLRSIYVSPIRASPIHRYDTHTHTHVHTRTRGAERTRLRWLLSTES